jgi:hypothetical protein
MSDMWLTKYYYRTMYLATYDEGVYVIGWE